MKKAVFLSIYLFATIAVAHAQFGMPSFKETVTQFFTHYAFDSESSYIKFQRKKDGWHIAQYSYRTQFPTGQDDLFWSLKQQSYLPLPYNLADDSDAVNSSIRNYLNFFGYDYELYCFERIKYYGYAGWDWDMMNDSTENNTGIDTLLEAKARAYSNYASGFIANQYGDIFINNDTDRIILKDTEQVCRSRIDKFINYELKAIEAYQKLLNANPNYITKVGNIKIKLANEYMYMYSILAMVGDSAEGLKYAQQADYPDSLLKVAQQYLRALPQKSILITLGDNDTYPVWYLQQVKHFRPDVITLCQTLLSFKKYLYAIDKQYRHTLFSTADSIYLKDNFKYFLYNNSTDKQLNISVSTFLRNLEKGYNPYAYVYNDSFIDSIKTYYSRIIYFSKLNTKQRKTLKLSNVLYLNDYFLLDIINTQPNGSVYFTMYYDLLSDLLTKENTVYKVRY